MLLSLCKLNSNSIVLDLTGLACQKHSIGIFSCTSWPVSDRLLLKLMNKVNTNGKSSSGQEMLPWSLAHKTTRLLELELQESPTIFPFQAIHSAILGSSRRSSGHSGENHCQTAWWFSKWWYFESYWFYFMMIVDTTMMPLIITQWWPIWWWC